MVIHLFLGGIFFYLLARELNLSFSSSLFSSVVFTFSGFLITHLIHMTMVNAFIWLPLLFFFLFRAFKNKSLRDAVWAGVTFGITNLAGHPQITLHLVYTLLLFFLFSFIFQWRVERSFVPKREILFLLLVFLLGFGLAGIQYLPSYEHSRYTLREAMTFEESADVSLPLHFPLLLLIPKFFGSITGDGTDSVFFWGEKAGYYYWETALYLGIIPLIFVLFGIFFNRSKEKTFFLLLAIIALVAALGKYTPFYKFLFHFLPGFNRFRIPARFVGLFTFSLAVLAGFGLESFSKGEGGKRCFCFWRCLILFLIIATFFWFLFLVNAFQNLSQFLRIPEVQRNVLKQYNTFLIFYISGLFIFWLERRIRKAKAPKSERHISFLAGAVILLTFADLYLFGKNFNLSSQGPEDYYPENQLVRRLKKEREEEVFRINARKDRYMVLKRNEGMIHRLELLEGYTPLGLADYATFNIPSEKKVDLLNAKYKIRVDERKIDLVFNPTYLPRAKVYYRYLLETDRKKQLRILGDEGFDYQNVLILEKVPNPLPAGESAENWVRMEKLENDQIELKVYTEKPGILFLSEIYYPNWKVKVDGKEGEVYRANYCLRAVPLTPGEHFLTFYYDKKTLRVGAFITLLTVISVFGLLWLDRQKVSGKIFRR